jgi:hypothetical protein
MDDNGDDHNLNSEFRFHNASKSAMTGL